MSTFQEKLNELTHKKHILTVWEMLHAHLDEHFISKDSRAAKLIKADGCLEEIVPESVIDQVLDNIASGPITTLRAEIEQIQNATFVAGPITSREESKDVK